MGSASVSRRVGDYRRRLRSKGFRLVQLWVPDTRRPGFAAMCRRQSRLLRDDPNEALTLASIAELSDIEGWV